MIEYALPAIQEAAHSLASIYFGLPSVVLKELPTIITHDTNLCSARSILRDL